MDKFRGCLIAMAISALVMNVSSSFKASKKAFFNRAVFAGAFAASVAVVYRDRDTFRDIWEKFSALSEYYKFILTILVVSSCYFGGFFHLAGLGGGSEGATPASSDNNVEFDVPSEISNLTDDKDLFIYSFEKFTNEIIDDLPTVYELNEEAVEWVRFMIKYTVDGGKMNRGLAVMEVQKILANGRALSNKERLQSAALGWCVEFLQAFFLVADDLMDDSKTRRGQPCWFRRNDVKLIAINDSFILESLVYKILKRYFGSEPYYMELVDLFLETTRQTEFGQLLDLTSQKLGQPIDLHRFTMERYSSIVKYKTAFYSFYLPVALGMIVAGVKDPVVFSKAKEILCHMGEYFQVQDDYLDCYGTYEQIGKHGTDIEECKCGWLVVQALNICNSKQRKILEENYGRDNPKSVAAVKALYRDLRLEELFREYEEESYNSIQKSLAACKDLPAGVFEFLLKRIYKRSK